MDSKIGIGRLGVTLNSCLFKLVISSLKRRLVRDHAYLLTNMEMGNGNDRVLKRSPLLSNPLFKISLHRGKSTIVSGHGRDERG